MRNIEILKLYEGLQRVNKLGGSKFAYAVGRDLALLQPVVDAINKALKLPEDYYQYKDEFEKNRLELCKKHCRKDENGVLIIKNSDNKSEYDIADRNEFVTEYNQMVKELNEKYSELKARETEIRKEYEEFLNQECGEELNLIKIKEEWIIDDGITGEMVAGIERVLLI